MDVATYKRKLGYLLFFACLSACAERPCPLTNSRTHISGSSYHLTVELARTHDSRRCGLAFRDALPPDQGMLFVFEHSQPLSFWMQDTHIPLAIAFLDQQGKILNIRNMEPMSTLPRYRSRGPARYALEVNQGWFAKHGIQAGDTIRLPQQAMPESTHQAP